MRARSPWLVLLCLIVLSSLPAYAYADPSGGMLFQVLMPMLAAIWGMWMIFAHNIRRRVSNLIRKFRGGEPDADPGAGS